MNKYLQPKRYLARALLYWDKLYYQLPYNLLKSKEVESKKFYDLGFNYDEALNEVNKVLNETAMSDKSNEWETLGGSTYTSDKINEVVGSSYADMMNGDKKPDADTVVKSMGGDPNVVGDTLKNALTRDYSDLMKAMDKK